VLEHPVEEGQASSKEDRIVELFVGRENRLDRLDTP
jgi:hypothetical protein